MGIVRPFLLISLWGPAKKQGVPAEADTSRSLFVVTPLAPVAVSAVCNPATPEEHGGKANGHIEFGEVPAPECVARGGAALKAIKFKLAHVSTPLFKKDGVCHPYGDP